MGPLRSGAGLRGRFGQRDFTGPLWQQDFLSRHHRIHQLLQKRLSLLRHPQEQPAPARYRLSKEDILLSCEDGYRAGFRTFVLQGGEDPWFSDERMAEIVRAIREGYPDCAITLSLGERSRESYQRLFDAGADRYLLRHETADQAALRAAAPAGDCPWKTGMRCLYDLARHRLSDGLRHDGGHAGAAPRAPGERHALHVRLSAPDDRHRAFSAPPGHALSQ